MRVGTIPRSEAAVVRNSMQLTRRLGAFDGQPFHQFIEEIGSWRREGVVLRLQNGPEVPHQLGMGLIAFTSSSHRCSSGYRLKLDFRSIVPIPLKNWK
jgi:hypothetical protein